MPMPLLVMAVGGKVVLVEVVADPEALELSERVVEAAAEVRKQTQAPEALMRQVFAQLLEQSADRAVLPNGNVATTASTSAAAVGGAAAVPPHADVAGRGPASEAGAALDRAHGAVDAGEDGGDAGGAVASAEVLVAADESRVDGDEETGAAGRRESSGAGGPATVQWTQRIMVRTPAVPPRRASLRRIPASTLRPDQCWSRALDSVLPCHARTAHTACTVRSVFQYRQRGVQVRYHDTVLAAGSGCVTGVQRVPRSHRVCCLELFGSVSVFEARWQWGEAYAALMPLAVHRESAWVRAAVPLAADTYAAAIHDQYLAVLRQEERGPDQHSPLPNRTTGAPLPYRTVPPPPLSLTSHTRRSSSSCSPIGRCGYHPCAKHIHVSLSPSAAPCARQPFAGAPWCCLQHTSSCAASTVQHAAARFRRALA